MVRARGRLTILAAALFPLTANAQCNSFNIEEVSSVRRDLARAEYSLAQAQIEL